MSTASEPAPPARSAGQRRAGRWTAIVAVSLLVHLAMLDALPDWTLSPPADPSPDAPLRATLMPPVATPPPAAPTPPPPTPTGSAPARERPTARPTRPTAPEFVPESMEPVPEIRVDEVPGPAAASNRPAAASAGAPSPEAATPAGPVAPVETSAPPAGPPASAAPSAPVAPPPAAVAPQSARLEYKVVYVDAKNANPVRYYGVGAIDWVIDDGRYRSDLVAAVDFLLFKVNVLASHSEGGVGPGGLAPDRYTETPRKRSTVATSFNRDARQTVSFSASPATVPLLPGTQDRLSVLFQIGALLLAADGGASTTAASTAPAGATPPASAPAASSASAGSPSLGAASTGSPSAGSPSAGSPSPGAASAGPTVTAPGSTSAGSGSAAPGSAGSGSAGSASGGSASGGSTNSTSAALPGADPSTPATSSPPPSPAPADSAAGAPMDGPVAPAVTAASAPASRTVRVPTAIDIPVAGVRGDVDPWRFDVLGTTSIDAAGAPLTTTHLRRAPRPGSGDRTIDVWVAVENGGYPARVLYTEPNGSTIEMTLARIAPIAR